MNKNNVYPGDKGDKGAPGLAGLPASLASILDESLNPEISKFIKFQ